jgi:hypothetical protein
MFDLVLTGSATGIYSKAIGLVAAKSNELAENAFCRICKSLTLVLPLSKF